MPPNLLIKPVAQTKQPAAYTPNTTGVGPQNVGLPGYRPGDAGNPNGTLAPGLSAPAPLQAPVAPPPPPPPLDFNALTLADPQYTTANADLQRQNALTTQNLLNGFRQTAQGYQDNANAHGALFSGAAIHAQNYAGQNYADQSAQQAANVLSNQHANYNTVYNRLLNAFSGVTN